MVNLQNIHSFIRDPLTDKLFHKYVRHAKARRVFETTVRLIELAVVAAPLIITAVNSVREIASSKSTHKRSGLRRLVSA